MTYMTHLPLFPIFLSPLMNTTMLVGVGVASQRGRVSPCVTLSGSQLQAEQTHGGGARGEGGCQRGRSVADLEGH